MHQKWEGRFESFKAAHGKVYEPEEHNVRINNYRNNYRYDALRWRTSAD